MAYSLMPRQTRPQEWTRLSAAAIRGFDSGFGLGFVVDPLARSAAVFRKSFVFSSLSIRKVLVLPFAGGVSPPLPVFSLLFSVSYPQDRRSYYLFFNYLFFNYLYGSPVTAKNCRGGVSRNSEELPGGGLP